MNNKYKTRSIVCKGCGKKITKRMPKTRKYCSIECYRKSKRPQCKTGEIIKCEQCGKESYKVKFFIDKNKHNFCSLKCANEWQGRNKLVFICKVCGKEFRLSKSLATQPGRNPTYCCVKCRDKDPEYMGPIYGNMAQQNKKGLNKIEKIGHDILDDLNIEYKEQVLIAKKFLVDVYIPESNIIIQWDGDYWHGYNKNINEVEKRIATRMNLDKSQDAYMKKCRYKILRFWEHDLLNNKKEVYEIIKKTI